MAEAQPAAAPQDGGEPEAKGPGWMGMILQFGIIYFLMQRFMGSGATPAKPEGPGVQPAPTLSISTPLPRPGGAGPATLMGIKMGLEYPPALEEFHTLRRMEIAHVPRGTMLGSAWEAGTPFSMHVYLCDHTDPDLLTAELQSAAEGSPGPDNFTPGNVTTFEFQGSGSFILKAVNGVASLVSWATGASKAEEAEEPVGTGAEIESGPGGSPATALLTDFQQGGCVPLWHQGGMTHDHEPHNFRSLHLNVTLPPSIAAQNASAYVHVWVAAEGVNPSPTSPTYTRRGALHTVHPLVVHMPKKKDVQYVSLLGGEEDESQPTPKPGARDLLSNPFGWNAAPEEEEEAGDDFSDFEFSDPVSDSGVSGEEGDPEEEGEEARPIVAYWRPEASVSSIVDFSRHKAGGFPPYVGDVLQVDADGVPPAYLPLVYVSDFWSLSSSLVELNGTTTTVPLHLTFAPTSLWKFSLQNQMDATWSAQTEWGTHKEGESDMLKKLILDTNPWLLGVTALVSLLHMVFEFLAFSNDVSFWRNTKSMEGLSLRTLGMNVFFQIVILLYLWDNDTSWMILMSSLVGLGIECWKLSKAIAVGVSWPAEGGLLPTIQWETKDDAYVRSKTKEYDDMAMSHLGVIMFPVVFGYATYSLLYDTHKSWFSWVITSLTGMVYAFGFILLTPQLFINYRLKSVAHLPWKALTYRFFNTIVDDLFAFVVEMPTMHRLSVFRDDIVFLIYLYQRWIYRVDPTRANIYGASGEDYAAAELRAKGQQRTVKRSKWAKLDGSRGPSAPALLPAPPAQVQGGAAAEGGEE